MIIMFHYQTYNFQMQRPTFDTNLRRVVKQPLGQVREHVVQVFRVAVLNDGPRGFDDRHSDPGVLMSDGLHERFDQTLSLHVKVFWRKSGKSVIYFYTFYFSYLLDG